MTPKQKRELDEKMEIHLNKMEEVLENVKVAVQIVTEIANVRKEPVVKRAINLGKRIWSWISK